MNYGFKQNKDVAIINVMNKKTSEQRPVFPFTSIVGQEEMFVLL